MLWMWETRRPACAVLRMACPTGTQGWTESFVATSYFLRTDSIADCGANVDVVYGGSSLLICKQG